MKILMTGATGLLGRSLLAKLAGRHDVVAICRTADPGVAGLAEVVQWDLAEPLRDSPLPDRFDAIVHLAQSPWYKLFPDRADDVFRINVASTADLLDYGRRVGVERFLLASSGNVYSPYLGALAETDVLSPTDFYGATKAAAESLLTPYSEVMTTCALRLFFLYGPGQRERLVPNLAERIQEGRPITLAGRGGGLELTPTFVGDVADLFVAALEQRWSGRLNVATPHRCTLQALAEAIGRRLGKAPRFEWSGGDEPPAIVPDLSCLRGRYDLARFRPLEDGLRLTLADAVEGPDNRIDRQKAET